VPVVKHVYGGVGEQVGAAVVVLYCTGAWPVGLPMYAAPLGPELVVKHGPFAPPAAVGAVSAA